MFRFRRGTMGRQAVGLTYALLFLIVGAARAETPAKYGNALDIVPADAAFFSSSMRMKEEVEIVANSKAWQKFTDIPAVKQAWGGATALYLFYVQPNITGGEENQQLLALVGDLFSHEIFIYGDQHSVDDYALYMSQLSNTSQNWFRLSEPPGENDAAEKAAKEMGRDSIEKLAKNLDKLVPPTVVLGFKHTDAARAKAQLTRLEKLINDNIDQAPKLKGRFHRQTIGDGDYLTLHLDGGMVPWNEIPRKEIEKTPGEFDKLFDRLKGLTLDVSLGVRPDYVLLSIGPTNDHLAHLGEGKRIAERPEFAPLAKFVDKRLTSISFASKEARIAGQFSGFFGSLNSIENALTASLATSGIPAGSQAEIRRDIDSLKGALAAGEANLGPTFDVSFLTDRGIESFGYDWSKNRKLDGSKPLDILEHLGGSPLVALINRTKYTPEVYQAVRRLVQKAYHYFDTLAVPQMKPDEKKQYHEFMEFAKPLMDKIDVATGSMLLPALADGQCGLVIDAKLSSRAWFKQMPKSPNPLPMIEPAAVVGVSDPDLLKKAFGEYREVLDAIIAKIAEKSPDALPPGFKLPDPNVRESHAGTIFSYTFPKELGVDSQLALGGGLNKTVGVLTVSPKHTVELLTATPFEADGPIGGIISGRWQQSACGIGPARWRRPRPGSSTEFARALSSKPAARFIPAAVAKTLPSSKTLCRRCAAFWKC